MSQQKKPEDTQSAEPGQAEKPEEKPGLSRSERVVEELQRLLAEFVGTFALVLVEAGGVVVAGLFHQDVNSAAHYASCGLIVMALIYALGSTSGAHINPAITFAFALRKDFPWRSLPAYWLAQVLGAIAGAALVRVLFGETEHLGAPLPHLSIPLTFAVEALLTFLLVTVVLGIAPKGELVGNNVAISVGGTVALCGLFAGRVSGASMNPARAFGPYLVSGQFGEVWLYILAPFAGALLAVGLAWLLRGETTPAARDAARGGRS